MSVKYVHYSKSGFKKERYQMEVMSMVIYHLDQVVVTCFCLLPMEIMTALKELDSEIIFSFSKNKKYNMKRGKRTNISLSDPSNQNLKELSDLLCGTPHVLSKIEIACDTIVPYQFLADEALEYIEKNIYRKYSVKYKCYTCGKKGKIKKIKLDKELIGNKTLYCGPISHQFVVYVRKYKGDICLRKEIRICHHHKIKKITGVDELVDLILNFDPKCFFDEWYDKFIAEGKIDTQKAVTYFFNFPRGSHQHISFQLMERTLAQAYSPALFRRDFGAHLKVLRHKHGRKSKKELKLLHRSIADFVKPKKGA